MIDDPYPHLGFKHRMALRAALDPPSHSELSRLKSTLNTVAMESHKHDPYLAALAEIILRLEPMRSA